PPPLALQARPRPASRARGVRADVLLRRPRGVQRLRVRSPDRRRARGGLPPASRRGVPGVLRALATAAPDAAARPVAVHVHAAQLRRPREPLHARRPAIPLVSSVRQLGAREAVRRALRAAAHDARRRAREVAPKHPPRGAGALGPGPATATSWRFETP